jgi:hypothetical protein
MRALVVQRCQQKAAAPLCPMARTHIDTGEFRTLVIQYQEPAAGGRLIHVTTDDEMTLGE